MQRRQRFVDWKDYTQVITHKLEERVGMRVRRDRSLMWMKGVAVRGGGKVQRQRFNLHHNSPKGRRCWGEE